MGGGGGGGAVKGGCSVGDNRLINNAPTCCGTTATVIDQLSFKVLFY